MSTETEPANAFSKLPKHNTWTIIFIAVDIRGEDTVFENLEDDAIKFGIDRFINDVKGSLFSKELNINVLTFISNKPEGCARICKYEEKDGKYDFIEHPKIKFNCQSEISYATYLQSLKLPPGKKLIIFLAHSFGAGFLENKPNSTFFSSIQLRDAIDKGCGKVDCLLAVNCIFQSIETNCIFRKTAALIIGSQQELHVKTIFYQDLLKDLASISTDNVVSNKEALKDKHLFTKFILNCHAKYIGLKYNNAEPFAISLCSPERSIFFMVYLNTFGYLLGKINDQSDFKYIEDSKVFCEDPAKNDMGNIVDARQFFERLYDYFSLRNRVKAQMLQYITKSLQEIVVFQLVSGDVCKDYKPFRIYLPHGIGLFLEKVQSNYSRGTLTIYEKLYDSVFLASMDEWKEVVLGVNNDNTIKNYYSILKKLIKNSIGNIPTHILERVKQLKHQ